MQHTGRHRSPGMTAIYNAVKNNARNQVLDLGACIAGNLEFFSNLGCHFHFENLTELLTERLLRQADNNTDWLDWVLKSLKPHQRFDIILVWDLFNFLSLEEQAAIYTKLETFIKPNSLFYLMNYVGAQRPSAPSTFKIESQYNIEVINDSIPCKNQNRTSTMELLKSLPKLQMLRSYINIEGMQGGISEHILSHKPEGKTVKSVFSNAEVLDGSAKVEIEFKSPAISQVYKEAETRGKLNVLDLGGRRLQNEERWKAHFDDVYTVDFRQVLNRLATVKHQSKVDYLKNGSYFHFDEDLRFDVIIAWDFMNFLDDDLLQAVGSRLAKISHDGTLLCCINYNSDQIPAAPRQYALTPNGFGIKNGSATELKHRERAPLNSLKVQKCLPGFFIKNAYTIQPGMQRGTSEYILVFKNQQTQDKEKAALYEQVMQRRRLREEPNAEAAEA